MKPILKDHPDKILLLAYLDAPISEELKDVRRHVVSCSSCREFLAKTQSIMGAIKHHPIPEAGALSDGHPEEQDIANYVEWRTGSEQVKGIKSHLDACGLCTKRALHYALHSAEMRRVLSETPISNEAIDKHKLTEKYNPPIPPLKKRGIWKRIFSWRIPAWFGVPATAFATAILVFIHLGQDRNDVEQQVQTVQQEKAKIIIAYQEKPEITFSPIKGKTPGIGFFSQSRGETRPFAGLTVQRVSRTHYHVSWIPIEGVASYDIHVFTDGPIGKRSFVMKATGIAEASTIMDLSPLDSGERYLWELTGHMNDGRLFMTSGGFVVALYP